ncbi:protein-lysine N-methyltransferase EEF2KMT-like [Pollicipes pollicipes]|uniref:protein-lysine N-methyltransferase EEF2KMT-like n=1 Tax=Pollicipes pollicipes TaxID=41117 RepID=UPI001885A10D|nr:protein-lysine N-methyltransferase EEF2KMT-like [Pollicipes pollicipes]
MSAACACSWRPAAGRYRSWRTTSTASSSAADADRTDGHVVYQLTETAVVALWEDRRLMAADTTGLRTWQAGKALLDWYLLRPEAIQGRRVLELGAGLGLTGLALCRTCSPASYHVTDGHPLVVEMLKYNVLKNLELAEDDLPVVGRVGVRSVCLRRAGQRAAKTVRRSG